MGDDDPYSIPHTNVLKNKLGIACTVELNKAERLITSVRTADVRPLKEFSLTEYLNIHKTLFQDIYQWAGQPRHQMPVFYGVGSEGFKSLSEGLQDVDKTLKGLAFGVEQLKLANIQQFSEVAARVFCVINKAHVFRDGNGRTQRLFLAKLAEAVGLSLNIQYLSGAAWNIACMLASSGDKSYLSEQIQFALEPTHVKVIQKSEAKAQLLSDYKNVERLASTQISASFDYNADKLVTQIVTVIGRLDEIKGRLNVHVPDNVPRLLIAQLMPSVAERKAVNLSADPA